MSALLLPVSLALQTALFALRRPSRPGLIREAFLKACVSLGLIATIIVEILSLGAHLSFVPLLGAWTAVVLIQLAAIGLLRGGLVDLRVRGLEAFSGLSALPVEDRFALAAAGGAFLFCGATAFLCPPNNFDSMTYHLPKVMHWIQNRSVGLYPANDLRQLAFPPGAEYLLVQLQILAGGDRFANGVQWLAFGGALAGVSLIARRLGAGSLGRTLAVLLAAGLPMAVLQAETTQTDLLTAFWLVCFSMFALKDGDYEPRDLFWLSTSLGLAIVTKPTGLIFGAPLLLVVLFRLVRRSPEAALTEETVAKHAAVTAAVFFLALLVSVGPLSRNKAALGRFFPEDGRTLKSAVGLRQTAASAMKNAALELPLPFVWKGVLGIEKHVLGLSPEDPAENFSPQITRFLGLMCWELVLPDEDMAAAPVQFVLLLVALGILGAALWREQEDPWSDRTCFIAALMLGFLIFSAFFKWQEWANRLMLPLFLLAAPWTAQVLEPYLPRSARKALLGFLGVSAILYSATAVHRPLLALPAAWTTQWQSPSIISLDREAVYESGYGQTHKKPFHDIVQDITKNGCGHVGLNIGINDWEYAWWALLDLKSKAPVMIKELDVKNASGKLAPEFPSPLLCAAVVGQGGIMIYYDNNDLDKMRAAGNFEPPSIADMPKH